MIRSGSMFNQSYVSVCVPACLSVVAVKASGVSPHFRQCIQLIQLKLILVPTNASREAAW